MGEARGAARPELRELRFAGPAAREPRGSSHDPFVPSIVSAKLCWVGTPYANYISLCLSLYSCSCVCTLAIAGWIFPPTGLLEVGQFSFGSLEASEMMPVIFRTLELCRAWR